MPPVELSSLFEVFVVDDEPDIRELLVDYFRAMGFRVTGASDGSGAIAILQRSKGRFGLVVTDLNLPGADGFAVLQAARQANANCYVVIVTGYASLDSAIHAVRVGAYDYLTKPFPLDHLGVILSRISERAGADRETRARPVSLPPARSLELPSPIESRVGAIEDAVTRIESLLRSSRR
jgi:DNA-binding NtrC family response regulator